MTQHHKTNKIRELEEHLSDTLKKDLFGDREQDSRSAIEEAFERVWKRDSKNIDDPEWL